MGMEMKSKAYWRGREIFCTDEFIGDWVKIAFWDPDSYFTGTGACWALMDDIVIEKGEA